MGPLNDEKKIKIDEKNNKNWKNWKFFENVYYHNFMTIRYQLTASGSINHSILNYKRMTF